jgi:hypothetical protein
LQVMFFEPYDLGLQIKSLSFKRGACVSIEVKEVLTSLAENASVFLAPTKKRQSLSTLPPRFRFLT